MSGISTWYREQKALSALKTLEAFKQECGSDLQKNLKDLEGMDFSDFKTRFSQITEKKFNHAKKAVKRLVKYANSDEFSARKKGFEKAISKMGSEGIISQSIGDGSVQRGTNTVKQNNLGNIVKDTVAMDREKVASKDNFTSVNTAQGSTNIGLEGIVPKNQVEEVCKEMEKALAPGDEPLSRALAFSDLLEERGITPGNFKDQDPKLQEAICSHIHGVGLKGVSTLQAFMGDSNINEDFTINKNANVIGRLNQEGFEQLYDGDRIETSLKAAVIGALFENIVGYWQRSSSPEKAKKLMHQIGINTAEDLNKLSQNCRDKCVEALVKAGRGRWTIEFAKSLGMKKLESAEDFKKLPDIFQRVFKERAKMVAEGGNATWLKEAADAVGLKDDPNGEGKRKGQKLVDMMTR